jgi:tRNA-dihydrouridine synthase A
MLGREAYHRPVVLARLDALVFGTEEKVEADLRARAIERMRRYTERQLALGERLLAVVRHLQGLYEGEPGAGEFRRTLGEGARRSGAGAEVLAEAVASAAGSAP